MILVTGISGHSGRLFAQRLAQERYEGEIRCLCRPGSDTKFLEGLGLNYSVVTGDITDDRFLDEVTRGVVRILHIASIRYSRKIVESAIRNGVRWVVLVHTTGRYSKFKSAAEDYIRIDDGILGLRDKIAVTILRPTMIYGSSRDQNMFKLVDYLYRHKFFPVFGNGRNLMQPVHAQDLADAYYAVLEHPGGTVNREYDLSGKEPVEYIELVRTVSRLLGRNNILVRVPIWLSLLGAKAYNAIFPKALISVEQVMRMNEDKVFPHEAASRDFGYSPRSFADGIRGEVEEYLRGKLSA